ncbi:copper amine oxidase-like protein [Paenibacillus taihuensis]|uniref:Copper amine oxidase-like protein n=2 Tax=Paenibacillus taihuensis TaxID=1156355 RepID=A0A3D9RX28_9BACL|nr:copper amine oxidase-like protein [Paenibacillus taihuensis]
MLAMFVVFALLFAMLAALITYIVDPLQFYHKPFGYDPVFSNEQRYQNPGLARNYDYDTIIVGTSMTENFRPSEVDKALGAHTLKLSIRGSTADEQFKIAQLAIETGKVKQVLWGLDYFALKTGDQEAAGEFPDYLYDDNKLNDVRYLLNYSLYDSFFKGIMKQIKGSPSQSLEGLYNWNYAVTFGKKLVLKDYEKAGVAEAYFGLNEEPLDVIKDNFNTRVLKLIKAHPEVKFIVYYPPYSVLREVMWEKTNKVRYQNQLEMAVWMYEQLHALPNTEVYNFQTATEWTYNLDLYKDMSHHNQDVNSAIAEAIGQKDARYLMNDTNAQSFADELAKQVQTFALSPDGDPLSVQVFMGDDPSEKVFSSRIMPGEGELLVPVKEAAQAFGATLDWNQATKELVLGRDDSKIKLKMGDKQALQDDNAVELAYPGKLIGGTAYVPFMQLASMLGYKISSDQPNELSIRYTLAS